MGDGEMIWVLKQRMAMNRIALFLTAAGMWSATTFGQALSVPPEKTPPPSPETVKMWQKEADEAQARIHARWNVSIDLQMVAMEETKALELIPAFRSGEKKTVQAAWDRLQAMLKTKEAVLIGWPMVRTVDQARAVSETLLEKRYATGFEPPQAPGDNPPPKKPEPVNNATVQGLPLAFETRNLGTTLEVEPTVLDDGQRVYLRLTPQHEELLKMEEENQVLTAHNTLITVRPPLIAWNKSDLYFTVNNGERELIAVHKLAKPGNFIELDLVRAVVCAAE